MLSVRYSLIDLDLTYQADGEVVFMNIFRML